MPETKLLPCPFCGGEPTIDRHYIGQRKADYRIICKHCGARFFWFDRLFKAIEAWNKRTNTKDEA